MLIIINGIIVYVLRYWFCNGLEVGKFMIGCFFLLFLVWIVRIVVLCGWDVS